MCKLSINLHSDSNGLYIIIQPLKQTSKDDDFVITAPRLNIDTVYGQTNKQMGGLWYLMESNQGSASYFSQISQKGYLYCEQNWSLAINVVENST